ncbi:hypothetical protein KEM52_005007 [Ascosphaera acerosa]|nr:hypothetical protein KEM52_005007 [Ascosphaera acerosa]
MTLGTVSVSTKPPSERFPNGYGKMESLGSLSVSGLLLSGGLFMGVSSATALVGMAFPELSHMIEHIAMKVAKELRSSVLSSNAVHHRIDSLTSLVALATIAGANVLPSAAWLDPSGCLLISLMVVKAGYDNTRLSLLELADAAVDEDIRSAVSEAAAASLHTMPAALQDAIGPSVQQGPRVARVSGTKAGQGYLMVLTLVVPDGWTVAQTRMVENHVRLVVGGKVKGLKKLDIRFVPLSAVLSDEQELDRQLHTEEFIDPDAAPLHQHNQPLEQQQQAGGERACDLRAASPEKGLRTGSSTAIQSEAAPKSIRRQR